LKVGFKTPIMKKIFTPAYLLIATLFLLVTACEKEQISTNATVELSKEELAENYLADSRTKITFAVLEMDHTTQNVSGFVMDKQSNIRAISLEEATYLNLDIVSMSSYYTDKMFEESEVVERVNVETMAENVKQSRTLEGQKSYEADASAGMTSKIYVAFKPNNLSTSHDDCEDTDSWGTADTFVDKIVLSARGQYHYEPTAATEIALVEWLNSYDKPSTDSN